MGGGMNDLAELTEEQVARRIRRVGAERALRAAPDVVGFARAAILGRFGGEAGVEVRQERTPLHTGWTDSADGAYAQLLRWMSFWGPELGEPVPEPGRPWLQWREDLGEYEIVGFRADVAAPIAERLTRIPTRWLLDHLDAIERESAADEFLTDVPQIVWSLRAVVGMNKRDRPAAEGRVCPACGEQAVHGLFFGEGLSAAELRGDRWMTTRTGDYQDAFLAHIGRVTVECFECGHEVTTRVVGSAPNERALPLTERDKLRWIS